MKLLLFLLSLSILAISSGCVLRTAVTTDGRECQPLSEKQIEYLIVMTRNTVKKNAKKHKISSREVAYILRTKPDLDIRYRGDRFGTMVVSWETPYHIIGMRFDDHLDTRVPQCALMIRGTDGKKFRKPEKGEVPRRSDRNILNEQYAVPGKR